MTWIQTFRPLHTIRKATGKTIKGKGIPIVTKSISIAKKTHCFMLYGVEFA